MHGDFSLNPLVSLPGELYVLKQQGRVDLDSDWNRQVASLVDYVRQAVDHILGGSAATTEDAFLVKGSIGDLTIGGGDFYVDGYRCSSDKDFTLESQPFRPSEDYPEQGFPDKVQAPSIVYLDVWLRHLTHRDDPEMREVALGGADTTTRGVVVWQVKTAPCPDGVPPPMLGSHVSSALDAIVSESLQPLSAARLRAYVDRGASDDEPWSPPPGDGDQGPPNQLYRVEVHRGGMRPAAGATNVNPPTIKWARDNASVAWSVRACNGTTVVIEPGPGALPRVGDYVELVTDDAVLSGVPSGRGADLPRVTGFDSDECIVSLSSPLAEMTDECASAQHAILRRWNGVSSVVPGVVVLERGVTVKFEDRENATYRSGDYWLIPTRAASGDVIWRPTGDDPQFAAPHGVRHHYAPLAYVASGNKVLDARRVITPIAG